MGPSFFDLVDLPAGNVSIDVRFELVPPSASGGGNPVVEVAPAAAIGWKTLGLSAIALE